MKNLFTLNINLPPKTHIKIIEWNNSFFFLFYTDFYYYTFQQTKTLVTPFFDEQFNNLALTTHTPAIFQVFFKKILEDLFYSWNFFFVAKFRFKGKGYRIFRRSENRFIKFFFGHSHMRYIKFKFVHLLKPHKYKFVIYSNSMRILKKAILLVNKVHPKNLFTKRRIAYARQILRKRKGKGALI